MAKYLRIDKTGSPHPLIKELPDKFTLYLYGDVHVGAKSFHYTAFQRMLSNLRRRKNAYAICMGDLVEGQTTDHPHYDHLSIDSVDDYDLHTPDGQFEMFRDLIEPTADHHIGILKGNHDWRFDKVRQFVSEMCRDLEVPYLGVQGHATLNGVNLFLSHVGRRLPRGAKDPRQRRANREAALKRNLENMWGSAHGMFHGHTHDLLLAKPTPPEGSLVSDSEGMYRMRDIQWGALSHTTDEGFLSVHPEARFYGVTGTFRRSGHIQPVEDDLYRAWEDYAERAAFPPTPCGYLELDIEGDQIMNGREVFV